MVNHSCQPNCKVVHRDSLDGLGILCLVTLREVPIGEQITFSYEGNFWSTGTPTKAGAEYHIVRCRCAEGACPRRLWRKERLVPLAISGRTNRQTDIRALMSAGSKASVAVKPEEGEALLLDLDGCGRRGETPLPPDGFQEDIPAPP